MKTTAPISLTQDSSPVDGWFMRVLAIGVFAIFVFGFVMQSVRWFTAAPGDLGDPRLNSYFLEHVWLWMSGADVQLWSPSFFYPFQNILGFSDNHFGSVLFYALFRFFGFSREYAFDAWFVIGALLNFAACFWVLRRWQFNHLASAVGAFIFAASLPVLMADNTAQLNYRFAIPLAWYLFYQGLQDQSDAHRYWYFGGASLFVAEQFFCSIYLGLLLIYALVAVLVVWWWEKRATNNAPSPLAGIQSKSRKIGGIAMIGIAALLIGALLAQYHWIARQYGLTRDHAQVLSMLPKWSSYFLSDRSFISGLWSSNLGWFAQRQENQLFIGLGALFFFCAGVYACFSEQKMVMHRMLARVAFFSIAIVCLFTIQISGYSLYALILQLPGVSAIRSVGRVVLVLLFPAAILIALAVQNWQSWLATKMGKKNPLWFGLLAGVFPLMLLLPESLFARHDTTLLTEWRQRMQKMQTLMPAQVGSDAILFAPRQGPQASWAGELDGMLIAQDLGYPTLNGYSGSLPPGMADLGIDAASRLKAYAKWSSQSDQDQWVRQQLQRVVLLVVNESWLTKQGMQTQWNQTLQTNSEKPNNQWLLTQGWALPEPWGTWTDGEHAQLLIPLPKSIAGAKAAPELMMQVRPFINQSHPQFDMLIQVNDAKPQSVSWRWPSSTNAVLRIPISKQDLTKGYLRVNLQIAHPISPKALGMGEDDRLLGLGLESITLQ